MEAELERCPGIAAAAVFGLPDEVWGQTVAALLVADRAPPPDPADIAQWIGARLAPHKRPRRFAFVARLPQTLAGKLDRGALPAHSAALQPLTPTSESSSTDAPS